MAELLRRIESTPLPDEVHDLSIVDPTIDYSPYPEMFAEFFDQPGASLTVITQSGKRIHVESKDELEEEAYCSGSVGIGKGTCTAPNIQPGENHIETTEIDPTTDKETSTRFFHIPCYVQRKMSYAADVVDVNPSAKSEEAFKIVRPVSAAYMVANFGPLPPNKARR